MRPGRLGDVSVERGLSRVRARELGGHTGRRPALWSNGSSVSTQPRTLPWPAENSRRSLPKPARVVVGAQAQQRHRVAAARGGHRRDDLARPREVRAVEVHDQVREQVLGDVEAVVGLARRVDAGPASPGAGAGRARPWRTRAPGRGWRRGRRASGRTPCPRSPSSPWARRRRTDRRPRRPPARRARPSARASCAARRRSSCRRPRRSRRTGRSGRSRAPGARRRDHPRRRSCCRGRRRRRAGRGRPPCPHTASPPRRPAAPGSRSASERPTPRWSTNTRSRVSAICGSTKNAKPYFGPERDRAARPAAGDEHRALGLARSGVREDLRVDVHHPPVGVTAIQRHRDRRALEGRVLLARRQRRGRRRSGRAPLRRRHGSRRCSPTAGPLAQPLPAGPREPADLRRRRGGGDRQGDESRGDCCRLH